MLCVVSFGWSSDSQKIKNKADRGDVCAQCNLGRMYFEGKGIQQDYKQAMYWFNKAAEQGNAIAQNNLGVMYYKGQGVSRNYLTSYVWLNLSATNLF